MPCSTSCSRSSRRATKAACFSWGDGSFLTSQLGEALEAGAEVGLAQAQWKPPSPHTTSSTFAVISAAMASMRVAIARAQPPKPDLILSDEPTTSPDSPSAQGGRKRLGSLSHRRQSEMRLVTHDYGS